MTDDEINRLWQLSMNDSEGMRLGFTTQQHYFAALVAAAEREACARIVENYCGAWDDDGFALAATIRARGHA